MTAPLPPTLARPILEFPCVRAHEGVSSSPLQRSHGRRGRSVQQVVLHRTRAGFLWPPRNPANARDYRDTSFLYSYSRPLSKSADAHYFVRRLLLTWGWEAEYVSPNLRSFLPRVPREAGAIPAT